MNEFTFILKHADLHTSNIFAFKRGPCLAEVKKNCNHYILSNKYTCDNPSNTRLMDYLKYIKLQSLSIINPVHIC